MTEPKKTNLEREADRLALATAKHKRNVAIAAVVTGADALKRHARAGEYPAARKHLGELFKAMEVLDPEPPDIDAEEYGEDEAARG